jgi:hypothetical protein
MEKTKEQIASEWAGLKLEIFTDASDLKHIHPYITPKQCLRAMEAYAEQQVKLCNKPAVINNEARESSEGVAVCFNYKCPFDMNNEGVCADGSTKCTAKQTDL